MAVAVHDVEFGLRVEGIDGVALVHGTVEDGRFVLRDLESGEPPMEGPASAAVLQLALLADLGPRPDAGPDVPVLLADSLPSIDREGLLATWDAEAREGTALADGQVVVWTAWVAWSRGPSRRMLRSTIVADAGEGGLALVDLDEEGVSVRPATATDVWSSLTTLFPALPD